MQHDGFRVRRVTWHELSHELATIRRRVFIAEQNVPLELEQDGLDPDCIHALAETDSGLAIGTGRLMQDGRVGRMAVLAEWRQRGVGAALLRHLMDAAREYGMQSVHLHAQEHARSFYERHGYRVEGEPYVEAGIPHIRMRAAL
jgi:predicted GNAT family N-acyltransferase